MKDELGSVLKGTELYYISLFCHCKAGTAVAQWLRYCATIRKVGIPNGVIGIFH